MGNRVAGRLFFKIDGQQYSVKAGITYNLGRPKRESMSDAEFNHYFKETAQVPSISGELIDKGDVDLAAFLELDGVTITAELANGKTIVLRNAWQTAEGETNTEESTVSFKFDGESAEEIK
jgi:hypothetical protein